MNHRELYGHSIRDGFNKFISKNPHIYKSFEEQAFRAIKKGRTKISSDLIINYIRWEQFIESSDEHNNILSSLLNSDKAVVRRKDGDVETAFKNAVSKGIKKFVPKSKFGP